MVVYSIVLYYGNGLFEKMAGEIWFDDGQVSTFKGAIHGPEDTRISGRYRPHTLDFVVEKALPMQISVKSTSSDVDSLYQGKGTYPKSNKPFPVHVHIDETRHPVLYPRWQKNPDVAPDQEER